MTHAAAVSGGRDEALRPAGRRELRLAIVCYGGVSLCVYMHGVTKELHRLVKASRLLADGIGDDRATATECVYRELLAACAEECGARTDVVVDIVAGTSAGGINGIFLAKALAHNLSQDALRDLWFEKGDIKALVRGPRALPLSLKAPWLLWQGIREAPLRGKDMSVWLYDALVGMDTAPLEPEGLETLMPRGHALRLFVTMTDFYGYDRQVPIADPKLAHDRRHRHVFEFAYGNGADAFTPEHNLGLAFAARATSCFPGAFPPVSIPLFRSYLPDAPGDLGHTFFRLYELSGADADRTYFVDGGVLDNRPFGHVVTAIRRMPAEVEVDRRLLYLEPDPGGAGPAAPARSPATIPAILGAVSGIPRREPILDELLEVARLNERVRRVHDIVELSFDRIADQIGEILREALAAGSLPDAETVGEWQGQLSQAARADAGTTYATYVRSKIDSAVARLAATACNVCTYPADANHALLVRGVYRSWAEAHGLFDHAFPPSENQIRFLRDFDLDYGIRRLQFVLAGVNAWYDQLGEDGTPRRDELDSVKARLWAAIEHLRGAISGDGFPAGLRDGVAACFPVADVQAFMHAHGYAPDEYARTRAARLDDLCDSLRTFLEAQLERFSSTLYCDLALLTAGWPWARRQELLVRYLGFPFWDVLLFPIQSVADAGERDAVEVVRMSPRDSRLLRANGRAEKLDGVGLAHFRAFFARRYRENDYLWGRLDAAERLIGIVLGTDDPAFVGWCRRAFLAILDEEEDALGSIRPLSADLRRQAEALAFTPSDPSLSSAPALPAAPRSLPR